jgi:sigma-B regulation protein RsbU (phosphoserine phosphatase)
MYLCKQIIKIMLPFFKKKPITGYPKSFAKRLTWRIMLRMILIMILPVFLLFWLTYGVVTIGALGIGDRVLKGEKEEVRRITSDLYMAATNIRPFIEEDLDKPDRMYDIMNRMLKLNPYMRSCGIYFVEGYYPQKGRLFAPYASRRDSVIMESQDACDQGNDYVKAEWFKKAIASEEGYWANAFLDNDSAQSPLVAYLLPIHDSQHRTVAVLGVDLSLSWLNEKIQPGYTAINDSNESWDPQYQIYYYMTDSTGTVLIHPDTKRLVKERIQSYMTKGAGDNVGYLTINESKEDDIILDSINVFINTQHVKYTNWRISIVIPKIFIHAFGYAIAGIAITFILLGLLVVYFFGRRSIKKAVRPLNQLATTADEVAKGNFKTELPQLKSYDEIHHLRDSFAQMQQSLTQYVEDLRNATAQKAAIESELKVAHDIQMSMLPKTFPPYPERNDLDIYGTLTPAKGVGGDLFDFYIRDEQLFFCIGDVSGKGVPASLFMAVTRSLFRNISQHVSEPSHIVNALNQAQAEGNDTNMFVTLFVGVLDLKTGSLRYCNAGHDAPLLMAHDVCLLPCDCNLPIGVMGDFSFEQQEITFERPTTIFLFTDGLNEAENIDHAQFGDERIMKMAESLVADGLLQPTQVIRHMTDAVHTFVGIAEQSDDLTMLAIELK